MRYSHMISVRYPRRFHHFYPYLFSRLSVGLNANANYPPPEPEPFWTWIDGCMKALTPDMVKNVQRRVPFGKLVSVDQDRRIIV